MADRYYRLVSFIVNICPQPLRKMLIKMASSDNTTGVPYTDLSAYLLSRQNDIDALRKKRKLRDDQIDLLFPSSGIADESQWDVTLLACLLKELFSKSIPPGEQLDMDEIRDVRNIIQHLSRTSEIDNSDFDQHWRRLEDATLALAQAYSNNNDLKEIKQQIRYVKTNHMPDLGDTLRNWYEDKLQEVRSKLDIALMELKEVKENTATTKHILQDTTKKKISPTGEKTKRIKTVDDILTRMEATFTKTMRDFLPEHFEAPSKEVSNIKANLREKHHAIVTGSGNTSYLAAALSVIKDMDIDLNLCVEMNTPSDWRSIDPAETELVLFRDPFGSKSFNDRKAKIMEEIFDSVLSTCAETKEDREPMYVLFVTDHTVLTESKRKYDHEILEAIVPVFENTTEEEPADLTFGCRKQNIPSIPGNYYQKGITENFMKHYNRIGTHLDENLLKTAKTKLKEKKAVVLVGPKERTNTFAAVLAASSYELSSNCLLLTKPDEVLLIDANVCLVMITQFAGNYKYDENSVYDWYNKFDQLNLAVKEGKINILITCEKDKLEQCCKIDMHPLLEHRVELPDFEILKSGELVMERTMEYAGKKIKKSKKRSQPTKKDNRNPKKVKNSAHGQEQEKTVAAIENNSMKLRKSVRIKAVQNESHQWRQERTRRKQKRILGNGEWPIHMAAKKRRSETLQEIIKSDVNVDINARDHAGWTPLHEACYKGRYENALHLLNAGALVNAQGHENNIPLYDAAENGNKQLVELLLSRGANPEQRNAAGQSPMDVASSPEVLATLKAARPR